LLFISSLAAVTPVTEQKMSNRTSYSYQPIDGGYLVLDAFGRVIGKAFDNVDGVIAEHCFSGSSTHFADIEAAANWMALTDAVIAGD
jgi:hypothetical protein